MILYGPDEDLFCSSVLYAIQRNSSGIQEAEAQVVVPIARVVPVPTSRTQIPRGVVPTPAAYHARRALRSTPF